MTSTPTAETRTRMLAAHDRARTAFGVTLDVTHGGRMAWGWQGRTLGLPVSADQSPAWLRLASDPPHYGTFWWNGTDEAATLPDALPRPRLRATYQWVGAGWRYRADLFDRAPASVSTVLVLDHDPVLPTSWWEQLRGALDLLVGVPTSRLAVRQEHLDQTMPRVLGSPVDTRSPLPWTTSHGDLHFGNLCAPHLLMLDWEGWGLAPAGYDAARLYLACLARPATATRVRAELSGYLDSAAGRFAELVVITELLDNQSVRKLAEPLRARAAWLLSHP